MEPPGQPPSLIPITDKPKKNLTEFAAAAGEAVSKFGEYLGNCKVQDHGGGRAMGDDEMFGTEPGRQLDTRPMRGIEMTAQEYERMKQERRERRARGLSDKEAAAEAEAATNVNNSIIHLMNAAESFVSDAHKSVARPYDMSDTELTKRIVELLATSQREAADTLTRLQDLINPATLLEIGRAHV